MREKIFIVVIICISFSLLFLFYFKIISTKYYDNAYFHIETYRSTIDKDSDGIDDQTDILNGVKEYIATKPKYRSKYYETGYSSDQYGVCTDVVVNGLLSAGYDLMELVNQDIIENTDIYGIEIIDKKIDFRRVKNLNTYFKRNAISLTTDIYNISEWQGGDIVVFEDHIGVISDKRNKKGIPFLIHHASPYQIHYEENVLEHYKILAHFRIS